MHRELLRIKSLSSLLDQVGQQEHLYEIFVEATEQVFTQVSEAIQNGVHDESFLVEAFNIDYNSSAVITHFRVSIPRHIQTLYLSLKNRAWRLATLTCENAIASHKCMDEIEPS